MSEEVRVKTSYVSELRTHYSELFLVILRKPDGKCCSSPYFAFEMDISSMKFHNFLNEGETNTQSLGIS